MTDASKAIKLDPSDAFSYQIRGHAKDSLKNFDDALSDFNRAVELSPANAAAYAGRAGIKLQMDDYEGANADLDKALQLDPKSPLVYSTLGFLKEKTGDDKGALADFNRAAQLGAKIPGTHDGLALLQYKLSQWGPAMKNLRTALKLNPSMDDLRFYIWLIRSQTGGQVEANQELEAYMKSPQGQKMKDWPASIGRYLTGKLSQSNFISKATTTAKLPSAITGQVCDAYYYTGMKHLIAGDKPGAADLFQKCVDTKDDNSFGYINARAELQVLKHP